jgi:DNA-binding NarL/FixJ family response regulator
VLLADRHHGVTEGVRSLLQTMFDVVVMVADERSLVESATRIGPALAVVDLFLEQGQGLCWLSRYHSGCPDVKLIVVSAHDEPGVARAAREAGADGFVLKRAIATDLIPAAEAVLAGGCFS